jgi:hypothetical protein
LAQWTLALGEQLCSVQCWSVRAAAFAVLLLQSICVM